MGKGCGKGCGRKKKKDTKPWCWYCGPEREYEDETILIQHQKNKHFQCPTCHKKLNTATALKTHCLYVHKEEITRVPNARPGRDEFGYDVVGMDGIPDEDDMDPNKKQKTTTPSAPAPLPPGAPPPAPAPGQPPQGYGAPPPNPYGAPPGWPPQPYGGPPPGYGYGGPPRSPFPPPGYPGGPPPGYGGPPPGYGGPPPGYGGPPPGFHGAPPQGGPPPGYPGAPPPGYGAPPPGYGAPGGPPPGYGGPPPGMPPPGHQQVPPPHGGPPPGVPPSAAPAPFSAAPAPAVPSSEGKVLSKGEGGAQVYLVYDDEEMSMEEKRAMLPRYSLNGAPTRY